MSNIEQVPIQVNIRAIAGDPFTLTWQPSGATVSSPVVTVTDFRGNTVSTGAPSPSVAANVVTVAWSAANTAAIAALGPTYRWSLSVAINGGSSYQVIAGVFTLGPVGSAGPATSTTVATPLTVGGVTITGSVTLGGNTQPLPTGVKTANYSANASELVPVDCTAGTVTVTLPTAPTNGARVIIKKLDSSANAVTIACGGSDKFNTTTGATSGSLSLQYQAITVEYGATLAVWYVIGDDLPLSQLDARYNRTANNLSDVASASTALANLGGATALTSTAIKTSAYNANANELVRVDATSAPVTITLPTAPVSGVRVTVKKVDSSTNAVSVALGGTDRFNISTGATSGTLSLANHALTVQYLAGSPGVWIVTGDDIPLSQLDARYPAIAGPFTPTHTGATAGGQYVGTTASGAPASGTFLLGDWVTDQTGKRWTCTVAGTPGTWVREVGNAADSSFSSRYGMDLANSGTVYVSVNGNDSNTGLSWNSAFATIGAAQAALGAQGGVVEVGYGTFTVSSTGRFDSATFTSGSATVTDASIGAGDVGKYVISQYVQSGSVISSVTPGVSFVMSLTASGSGATQTLITTPAIASKAGVKIRGRGACWDQGASVQAGNLMATTTIQDNGTGITIMPVHSTTGQTTMRCELADMSVKGTSSNVFGLFAWDTWYVQCNNVDFTAHGVAGAALSHNLNSTSFYDCRFMNNGTSSSTKITGGVLLDTPVRVVSAAVNFVNCFFSFNYGWGTAGTRDFVTVAPGSGAVFTGCQWNLTRTSAVSGSGVSAYLGGAALNTTLNGCWLESPATAPNLQVGYEGVNALGCTFGANAGQNGAVAYNVLIDNNAQFNAVGCWYGYETDSSVRITLGGSAVYTWQGCKLHTVTKYVADTNGLQLKPSSQASNRGSTVARQEVYDTLNGVHVETMSRLVGLSNNDQVTLTNGTQFLTYFKPNHNLLTSQIDTFVFATASVGATLARIGLYTVDPSTYDITLVASTVNNTALWASTFSRRNQAWSASYQLLEDGLYAIGLISVGASTAPKLAGFAAMNGAAMYSGFPPILAGCITGQTDLVASFSGGSVSTSNGGMIFASLAV